MANNAIAIVPVIVVAGLILTSLQGTPQAAAPAAATPTVSFTSDGSTANLLQVLTPGFGGLHVRNATTSDSTGIVGIASTTVAPGAAEVVSVYGQATCVFDNPTNTGDYVQASSTVAGNCHDAGSAYPAGNQVVGRVLSTNTAAGSYPVLLFGVIIPPAGAPAATPPTASFISDGSTVNLLQVLSPGFGASHVRDARTSDLTGLIGIASTTAGTGAAEVVNVYGQATCVFDNATTAGDFVQASSTTNGDCHDAGAAYPTNSQVIGRVVSTNAAAGAFPVVLFGVNIQGGPGASGATAASGCKTTLVSVTEGVTTLTGKFSTGEVLGCNPPPTSADIEVFNGSHLLFTSTTAAIALTTGTFNFSNIQALGAGQSVHVHLYSGGAIGATGASGPQPLSYADTRVEELGYDWGRVKAYFTAGALFVRQQGAFGSADPYVSANVDSNWYTSPQLSTCPVRPDEDARLLADSSALIDILPLVNAEKLLRENVVSANDALAMVAGMLGSRGATGGTGAGAPVAAFSALDAAKADIGATGGTIGATGANKFAHQAISRIETILLRYPKIYCTSSFAPRIAHHWVFPDSVHASTEAAIDQVSFGATGSTGPAGASGAGITSQSGASLNFRVYMPYRVARWPFNRGDNALFLAPLFRVGFDAPSAASLSVPQQDVYWNYSGGVRLGQFALNAHPESRSPELLSYVDFTVGRWDEFRLISTQPGHTYYRPWRYETEGQLKLPGTPFYIGTTINVGPGLDDYRLFVGTRFDVSKMLSKIVPTTQ